MNALLPLYALGLSIVAIAAQHLLSGFVGQDDKNAQWIEENWWRYTCTLGEIPTVADQLV